jgi:tRNA-binding protein
MAEETKPIVSKEEIFDKLDIRLGRVLSIEPAEEVSKPAYVIKADFGKFGVRTSVGRFTKHSQEELVGKWEQQYRNFSVSACSIPRLTAERRR